VSAAYIAPEVLSIQRRALLDFLTEFGSEVNDEACIASLRSMGHTFSRDTFANEIVAHLLALEFIDLRENHDFCMLKVTRAGRDISDGQARHADISQFTTRK
jgi:hypothetical protein